jgi:hypothetical protein
MGSGSSARGQSAKVSPANEVTVLDGPALETHADRKNRERDDEEIRWLRMLIEKEKAEKEWLMSRYEHTERDLLARTEECARLRLQLAGCKDSATPEAKLLADGTKPPQLQTERASSPSPASPVTSPTMTLKERRGLKICVETNSRVTAKPPENVANGDPHLAEPVSTQVLQASALQKTQEVVKPDSANGSRNSTRTQEFLARLEKDRNSQIDEPMTAFPMAGSRSWSGGGRDEPMSPLLRRRRDGPRKSADRFKSSPGVLEAMYVMTPKIVKMDDVPSTPKRVPATPKTAKRRQESTWSTIVEDVVEEEEK